MQFFLLAVMLAAPVLALASTNADGINKADIIVLDGDTIRSRDVRLVGFDTPETGRRAKCPQEDELGKRATARLQQLVAKAGRIELKYVRCSCPEGTHGTKKCNFGRSCGTLRVDGRDVGDTLKAEGLARPYHCGPTSCPKRESWC